VPSGEVVPFALKVELLDVSVRIAYTGEAGFAKPHTETGEFRCSTIPFPKIDARRNGREAQRKGAVERRRRRVVMFFFISQSRRSLFF